MYARNLLSGHSAVTQMEKLRIFKAKKGSILELVWMHKQALPMVAGEERILQVF